MKRLLEDYKAIRDFYIKEPDQVPFIATMDELAGILFCTERNAKLILAKLVEAGWVSFSPGRGRGHKSRLTFLASLDEAAFAEATSLFKAGQITEGLELATLFGSPLLKRRLLEWLGEYFGYKKEDTGHTIRDIIRIPMFRTFNSITPSQAFFDFDVHLVKQIYDTIILYDYVEDKAIGKLAHHWESNQTKTEWTFYLRKGVLFHNNKELASSDIEYTFSLLLHPDYRQYWLVENIRKIECIDPYTIRFHLHRPNELFLSFLSFPSLSIIPSGMTDPIGTGPYRAVAYHEHQCILEAHPHYFEGRPFVDRIEILNVPREYEEEILSDKSSIYVNTGESNYYMSGMSRKQIEGLYEGSSLFTFNLSNQNRPQQSLFFRKAVTTLLDRNKLVAELGPPRVHPSFGFERDESLCKVVEKSRDEEIKHLLQKSGYNEEVVQLFTYDRHKPDADWIKKEAARFGIRFHIIILGWSEILKEEHLSNADCILFEAVWGENELSKLELFLSDFSFLRWHLHQETKGWIGKKIEEILATSSKGKRSHLFSEIESLLVSEYSVVFLAHKNAESSFHPSIKGVKLNARGHIDFKNLWIKPDIDKTMGSFRQL
ncbi:MAG: ABC transporter substrate-binding protein [Ectobacillus sp.]